jgi:hypothetical protein
LVALPIICDIAIPAKTQTAGARISINLIIAAEK